MKRNILITLFLLPLFYSCEYENSMAPAGNGNIINYGDTIINNLEPFDLEFPDGYSSIDIFKELSFEEEYEVPEGYNFIGFFGSKNMPDTTYDTRFVVNGEIFQSVSRNNAPSSKYYLPPKIKIKSLNSNNKNILQGRLFKKKSEMFIKNITNAPYIVPQGKILVFIHWNSYYFRSLDNFNKQFDINEIQKRFPSNLLVEMKTITINGIDGSDYSWINDQFLLLNEGAIIAAKPGNNLILNGYLIDKK